MQCAADIGAVAYWKKILVDNYFDLCIDDVGSDMNHL
jgi:hypothetical protein